MRFDDELAEGQTQSGAANAWNVQRLHLLELPEDDVMILGRDADAVVRDGEQRAVILAPRAEPHRDRAGGVREGILEQVAEDALHQRLICFDHGRIVRDLERDRRALL